ncbi:sensor histidine kinase [Ferrimonas balearica]|uniref:sensor histidine kinase n=1 Tax=Ferrimonas balearica TaxID=44012 RepID=UPI001C962646|nr:HAMP domain-containing sensor histidine kinase [Ferrimonas balearica]MBY6224675.1 HAMP domain-containing protein [Ferrimonas balearica]
MSLKRYLFLAFGSLMLLFTVMQWFLLSTLTDDFHQTLGDQSGQVARRVAEVTVENLFDGEQFLIQLPEAPHWPNPEAAHEFAEQQREVVIQQLEAERQRQESIHQELEALSEQGRAVTEHILTLNEPSALSEAEQAQLKAELEAVREQALAQARRIKVEFEQNSDRVWIQGLAAPVEMHLMQAPEQRLLEEFRQTLLIFLAGSGLVGLGLVYWLAQRLARPLEALDQGCQRLSEGELGHTIPPQGSSEVRHAIGAFNHMSGSLARMTEQQKTLQSRQHLAEIGEIARGLAHALRNPLHTIGLALEHLDQSKPDERARWRDQIRAKLRHMDRTLTALLTLAANGIDRQTQNNARALVDDIVLELAMANTSGVRFDNQVPAELTLTGAHSELRTMLHTLMVNAQEALAEQGGEDSEVVISARQQPGSVSLLVSDNGPGLSAAVANRLFEPHQTTKSDGSGMGLYLARRLARLWYQGDVTLSNRQPGPGCQATLTLSQGEQQ